MRQSCQRTLSLLPRLNLDEFTSVSNTPPFRFQAGDLLKTRNAAQPDFEALAYDAVPRNFRTTCLKRPNYLARTGRIARRGRNLRVGHHRTPRNFSHHGSELLESHLIKTIAYRRTKEKLRVLP